MSNYTEEEKAAILAEARELIADRHEVERDLAQRLMAQPVEKMSDRWRREALEQEEAKAAREREPSLPDAIIARINRQTAEMIAAERVYLLETFLPEVLAQLRKMTSDEIKQTIERVAAAMRLDIDALKHEQTKRKSRRASNIVDLPIRF